MTQWYSLLEEASSNDINVIVNELRENFSSLMTTPGSVPFCKKLINMASQDQRAKLLKGLRPKFLNVACDKNGATVFKEFVAKASTHEEFLILASLIKMVLSELAYDYLGSHVLVQVLKVLP